MQKFKRRLTAGISVLLLAALFTSCPDPVNPNSDPVEPVTKEKAELISIKPADLEKSGADIAFGTIDDLKIFARSSLRATSKTEYFQNLLGLALTLITKSSSDDSSSIMPSYTVLPDSLDPATMDDIKKDGLSLLDEIKAYAELLEAEGTGKKSIYKNIGYAEPYEGIKIALPVLSFDADSTFTKTNSLTAIKTKSDLSAQANIIFDIIKISNAFKAEMEKENPPDPNAITTNSDLTEDEKIVKEAYKSFYVSPININSAFNGHFDFENEVDTAALKELFDESSEDFSLSYAETVLFSFLGKLLTSASKEELINTIAQDKSKQLTDFSNAIKKFEGSANIDFQTDIGFSYRTPYFYTDRFDMSTPLYIKKDDGTYKTIGGKFIINMRLSSTIDKLEDIFDSITSIISLYSKDDIEEKEYLEKIATVEELFDNLFKSDFRITSYDDNNEIVFRCSVGFDEVFMLLGTELS